MYYMFDLLVIQIRDFEYNVETQDSRKQELEKLMHDQDTLRSSLLQWCYASYGEVLLLLWNMLHGYHFFKR